MSVASRARENRNGCEDRALAGDLREKARRGTLHTAHPGDPRRTELADGTIYAAGKHGEIINISKRETS